MKKIWLYFFLVVGLASVSYAQQEHELTPNLGIMSDKDFRFNPLFFTFSFVGDFHFLDYFMISPEIHLFSNLKIGSNDFIMDFGPSLSINYSPGYPGSLFIGAGVCCRFRSSTSSGPGITRLPLELKLNLGIRTHNRKMRFGAYLLTPFNDAFKTIAICFYVGFGSFWI